MNVSVIQTASLPYDKAKVNYFLSILRSKKVEIVVFGEYVLNIFFKEIENTPISFLKKQSSHQIKLFKKLSTIYNMTIIAPIIVVENEKKYKTIVKFSPKSTKFYYQQILMPYEHWNEKEFFDIKINKPLIFRQNGFIIGVMSGFEAHFDEFWKYFREKKVDLVIVPSVGTFSSKKRWEKMLSSFAFLNNCYVLRANRVGAYEDWKFYGDSFLADPNGNLISKLGHKEELLITKIDKKVIKESKKEWGFIKSRKGLENEIFN